MSNSAVCPVIISEEQQMATLLEGFTLPLNMLLAMDNGQEYEATLDMDNTVFDHELQKSWPNALAYVRHHRGETVSAKDAMRLLAIGKGCMEDTTLWQIRERHPGFLQDAGLTPDQIAFRNCVSFLPVPMKFTVCSFFGTGKDKKEHTVTLRENHLFSSKDDDGLSALEVCWIFKDWVLDPDLSKNAMTVLYYTDTDGKEWRLSEILALSPFLQKCFPAKPTDLETADEIRRFLKLAKQYTDMGARAHVMEALMEFLADDCSDYMARHPIFRRTILEKCDVIIASHAEEYPDFVATCKRLLTILDSYH
jgi:hypothetical protein